MRDTLVKSLFFLQLSPAGLHCAYWAGTKRIGIDAMTQSKTVGSVLVVGGGIAGMQAALDLADSGYLVHLVEKSSAIGGVMSELDKTFPTNDCAM